MIDKLFADDQATVLARLKPFSNGLVTFDDSELRPHKGPSETSFSCLTVIQVG